MDTSTPASFDFAGTVTRPEFARIQHRMLPVWARWYVLYPMVAAVLAFFTLRDELTLSRIVTEVLILVIVVVAMVVTTRRTRERAWRQAVRMAGRVHGAISPAGIDWNTDRSTAHFEWAQVTRIDRTENLTLTFLGPRSAFYFPRSFFASDAAWAAFNEAVVRYAAK
jgi:hypothetical protein